MCTTCCLMIIHPYARPWFAYVKEQRQSCQTDGQTEWFLYSPLTFVDGGINIFLSPIKGTTQCYASLHSNTHEYLWSQDVTMQVKSGYMWGRLYITQTSNSKKTCCGFDPFIKFYLRCKKSGRLSAKFAGTIDSKNSMFKCLVNTCISEWIKACDFKFSYHSKYFFLEAISELSM